MELLVDGDDDDDAEGGEDLLAEEEEEWALGEEGGGLAESAPRVGEVEAALLSALLTPLLALPAPPRPSKA